MTANLQRVRAISFDLDDTLWDCASAIAGAEHACYEWLVKHAPRVTESFDAATLLQRRAQILKHQPELVGDVTRLRKTMLTQTLAEFDYSSEIADAAFNAFYVARSEVQLYEGCLALLEGLKQQYQVAAITNGNANLKLVGIDHFFQSVHMADLDNPAKPHRHMFDQCLAQFDLPPSALLHVGDNPETDVAGAQAAGVQAVWFNGQEIVWPEALPRAEFEVRSLSELHELLLSTEKPSRYSKQV